MSSEFSAFKVPKEKDFLKIIEDAEDAGVLDKAAKAVNNPLSWLRFIPSLGVSVRQAEKQAEAAKKTAQKSKRPWSHSKQCPNCHAKVHVRRTSCECGQIRLAGQ